MTLSSYSDQLYTRFRLNKMDMFIFETGTIVTLCIFVLTFLLASLYMSAPKSNLPGPFAFPLVGNLPLLFKEKESEKHLFYQKMAAKYGSVYRLYYGNLMMVFINGYDAVNSVFVKQADLTTDRPEIMTKRAKVKGIVNQNGPVWKSLRRISIQAMRDFGVGKKSLGETVNEEVAVVIKYDHNDRKFQELLDTFDQMFSGEGTTSLGRILPWFKYIKMKEHKTTYDPNHCRDFIDLYLQLVNDEFKTKPTFDAEAFAATILAFFAAGTDTTAQTLNWAMLYMLGFPETQAKCQKEIDKVIGHGRMVSLDDKDKLVYVQATLMEIQRLSSIASSSMLRVTTGDVHVDGHVIPKGTIIRGNIISSLFDSKYWDDPLKFLPERFIGTDGKITKKEGFIPFFTGPRMCPGEPLAKMELFLVFSNILQRFNLEKPHPDTQLDFNGFSSVTFRPHPFQIRAVLR
ncbi:hypothetical protein KUTeg_009473 [Tegillarca granosa]|uniref:Uncharacterized protein n=1 Tax=Tegillarca granosa TaxID=220873 RepID=A0ABQ9F747_TEGGR|nr:hypothetical protein KUTeg_009473 [Tegillarca granosa]